MPTLKNFTPLGSEPMSREFLPYTNPNRGREQDPNRVKRRALDNGIPWCTSTLNSLKNHSILPCFVISFPYSDFYVLIYMFT